MPWWLSLLASDIAWPIFKMTIVVIVLAGIMGALAHLLFKKAIKGPNKHQSLVRVKRIHGLIILLAVLAPLSVSLRLNLILFLAILGLFILEAIILYLKPAFALALEGRLNKYVKSTAVILAILILLLGGGFTWIYFVVITAFVILSMPYLINSFRSL